MLNIFYDFTIIVYGFDNLFYVRGDTQLHNEEAKMMADYYDLVKKEEEHRERIKDKVSEIIATQNLINSHNTSIKDFENEKKDNQNTTRFIFFSTF